MTANRRGLLGLSLIALLVLAFAPVSWAADSVTGEWKWKTAARNGREGREMTLKLTQDGEKVTGTLLGYGNQEVKIADGKVHDGEISFSVTRKGRNDQEMTTKYSGKISGDSIKGKSESDAGGQSRSRDWEAHRGEEKKSA